MLAALVAAASPPVQAQPERLLVITTSPDLKSLASFVNQVLLPHESVQHVKTAIVLETLKENASLPLED